MIIANPMYDVVFKKMMENEKVAKFFIGTLLDQTIETIEVKPQEYTYKDPAANIALFRLDFIATLKTDTGERKKVLIEIQKAQKNIDLMRFRNYLAEQYKKEDKVDGIDIALPITTIYLLGFNLPDANAACIKVERSYKDLVDNTTVETKSKFIESLTHDSFIVQAPRIKDRYKTPLDKLLSIFEQSHFIDEKKTIKEFNHQADTEDIKITTDILHYVGTDVEERKKIEVEQEAWRTLDALTGDLRKKSEELLKVLGEKDKALDEKDKLIEELKRQLNKK